MTRAEQIAQEEFPLKAFGKSMRFACKRGYLRAEEELALTWEDMKLIDELFTEMAFSEPNDSTEWYQELANRFTHKEKRNESKRSISSI